MRALLTSASLLGLVVLLGLAACRPEPEASDPDRPLQVVATTTVLADLVHELGGDDVEVRAIVGPGGDPHRYKPTPGDARQIARADLVVTNGLALEGWIDDLIRNAGGDATVLVGAEGVEPLKDPLRTGYPDPHIWHDVTRWTQVAHNVRDGLVAADPARRDAIVQRHDAYVLRLAALDQWVHDQVDTIPADKRVLVTSHDAFQYYGKAYGFTVVAVQGVSTESEAGARDVARVVDLVRARAIPAVFIETSVNPKLVEQISRETGARIGGTLFSDALGVPPPTDTYEGMIRANTTLIVESLQPGA